jgi:hypothetical protein
MSASNHHARLIIGAWDKEALVRELLSQLGVGREHNPDFVVYEGAFGIDEARALGARVGTKPFGDVRAIIIDASQMTAQAQNALLKTLEEPGEGNRFFLVAPYEDILLPTLRSRLQKVAEDSLVAPVPTMTSADKGSSAHFLSLSPQKRLDFAKKFKDDERQLGPFLDSMLAHLKSQGREADMKKVFKLRRYADDTSADSRMILEHLALAL